MTVAPVYQVGDELNLTCTASVDFIHWSINYEQGSQADGEFTTFITSRATTNQSKQIIVNSAIFSFVRNLVPGASLLISTLSIDSVSIGLNGTVVHCRDASNPMTSASTTIQIMNIGSKLAIPHSDHHH